MQWCTHGSRKSQTFNHDCKTDQVTIMHTHIKITGKAALKYRIEMKMKPIELKKSHKKTLLNIFINLNYNISKQVV